MTYGDIKSQLFKKYYFVSDDTPVERLEKHIERRIEQTTKRSSKLAKESLKLLKSDLNTIKQIKENV